MAKTVVFSLGGSLIVPDEIDTGFISSFRKLILDFVLKGNRAIIVCGGGKICRRYNQAAESITKVSNIDLDWMGIAATRLNAELIRCVFSDSENKDKVFEWVVKDPTVKFETDKKIIIGAGFKPGYSSDKDAVDLAIMFSAEAVINMTNIDKVYTDDPRINPDAKPIDNIKWKEFIEIIGDEWIPGKNVPFDPIAAKQAMQSGIKCMILNGNNLDNLKNAIDGLDFTGTLIE